VRDLKESDKMEKIRVNEAHGMPHALGKWSGEGDTTCTKLKCSMNQEVRHTCEGGENSEGAF